MPLRSPPARGFKDQSDHLHGVQLVMRIIFMFNTVCLYGPHGGTVLTSFPGFPDPIDPEKWIQHSSGGQDLPPPHPHDSN